MPALAGRCVQDVDSVIHVLPHEVGRKSVGCDLQVSGAIEHHCTRCIDTDPIILYLNRGRIAGSSVRNQASASWYLNQELGGFIIASSYCGSGIENRNILVGRVCRKQPALVHGTAGFNGNITGGIRQYAVDTLDSSFSGIDRNVAVFIGKLPVHGFHFTGIIQSFLKPVHLINFMGMCSRRVGRRLARNVPPADSSTRTASFSCSKKDIPGADNVVRGYPLVSQHTGYVHDSRIARPFDSTGWQIPLHSIIVQNTNHSEQRGQRQICGILVVTGGLDRNVSLGECLRRGTSFTGTPSCGNVLDPYCIGKVRQCGILDLDMYMNLGAVREVTRRHQRESRSGVIRCVRHIQIRGYTWFSTATTSTRAVHNAVEDQFPGISDEIDCINHRRYQIIGCLGHGLEGYQLRGCSIKHQCFPLEIVPHVGRCAGVLCNDPT